MISRPAPRHYAAIFTLSFAVLMLEISVARVLSVALFSHYAFVAVSLAMFGIGVGGLVVYLRPDRFPIARVDEQVAWYASTFGLAAVLAELVFLRLPTVRELSVSGFFTLSAIYVTLAIPFYLGGVGVSLLMTHFSSHIGRIYFADLLGASLGCLGVVLAMEYLSAPLVPPLVAVVMSVCALSFALRTNHAKTTTPIVAAALSVGLLVAGFTTDLFTMQSVKARQVPAGSYEVWNSFSRVSAYPRARSAAEIVPLKDRSKYPNPPGSMLLDIDGAAGTPMMNFDGDVSRVAFLRDTVLYAAHWLKTQARVLIIGVGGGRDVIAALAAGQPRVLGIELNPLMRHVVDERFGDYSGRPYSRPGVEVIIDEGRSRLTHLDETFDIIQLSLIDTFALNAAGGFVFAENYLYTTEGLREYYRHLAPDGILSLTRYFRPSYPLEIVRLASLVRSAWAAEGVTNSWQHVVVLYQGLNATMLVKRSPFTSDDLAVLERAATEKGVEIIARPGMQRDTYGIMQILATPDLDAHLSKLPYRLDAPTDDQPFFFNLLRKRLDSVPSKETDPFEFMRAWDEALALMHLLIAVVSVLALLFLVGPLLLTSRRTGAGLGRAVPMLLYFACLGYGFMMIEIPLLQRFTLLLGYPTYALVVVLFALLLFSGLGSLATARFVRTPSSALRLALAGVLVVGLVYASLLPGVTHSLLSAALPTRIAATIALLAPIGLLLGMPYPLGIALLRGVGEGLVPWAWALNGAMGVVGSVLAAFIGSRHGFTIALFTGIGAYALALAMVILTITMRSHLRTTAEELKHVA